jgi:hypothetical protein
MFESKAASNSNGSLSGSSGYNLAAFRFTEADTQTLGQNS